MKEPSLLRASPSNGPMGKRAGILKEATLWKKLLDGRSTFLLNWSSSSNRDRERKKRNSIRCHPTERVPSSFVFILIFMYFTTISLYAYIVCLHIHIYIPIHIHISICTWLVWLHIAFLLVPVEKHLVIQGSRATTQSPLAQSCKKMTSLFLSRANVWILRASDSNISSHSWQHLFSRLNYYFKLGLDMPSIQPTSCNTFPKAAIDAGALRQSASLCSNEGQDEESTLW